MFAKSTIAIFEGSKGREYYSICDTSVSTEKSVYYDIDFPLHLALKINRLQCREPSKQTGFIRCSNCQIYGMYKNIAMVPCGTCMKQFPEYKCDCFDGRMSFTEYVDDLRALEVEDMTHWACGPECKWFAPNAIYSALDTKKVSLSKLHRAEVCTQRLAYMNQRVQEEENKADAEITEQNRRLSFGEIIRETIGETIGETVREEGEISDIAVEEDEETVLENFIDDPSSRSLSPQDQAVLDQFSDFCDRIMRGDHL